MTAAIKNPKIYDRTDFTKSPLSQGEYEGFTFTDCNFSGCDLSEMVFWECKFIHCNLSLAKLNKTALRDVSFCGCKMLGLHFDDCNPFGLDLRFADCILDHSTFVQLCLKKTLFKNCKLRETDFTQCDISSSLFENCDLDRATFHNTDLMNADMRTAYNYNFDPDTNRIGKAKFALSGLPGLLGKYRIEIDTGR